MSKSKPNGKSRSAQDLKTPVRRTAANSARSSSGPPTVSARWLVGGIVVVLVAALAFAWGTLCVLFWQGSWQLLYRPTSAVTQTPASVNLPFESVGFATTASGEPQLRGWWIPASTQARYTAIFLHGEIGNLGDTINFLIPLHESGLNVFAFDYRGYGQSHFVHPSEARWREDADSAIRYLTSTRHIPISSILLVGRDLGANLTVEVAALHPDLAGIVVEAPLEAPTTAIFNDPRAQYVPAHLLVKDRWNTPSAASNVLVPSLWFYWTTAGAGAAEDKPPAFDRVPARKTLVWLSGSDQERAQFRSALSAWLDQLPSPPK
jgi:pimeloyl-ACP methyl ester carboxylesterase